MIKTPQWGCIVETWVFSQLYKQIKDIVPKVGLYYWRTQNGAEVDFILEIGNKLIPIEVKTGIQLHSYSFRGIQEFIKSQKKEVPYGIILYGGNNVKILKANIIAVPLQMLY